MDSDGDGITNGEELGDPQCVWIPGNNPNRTTHITHPGNQPHIDTEQLSMTHNMKLLNLSLHLKSQISDQIWPKISPFCMQPKCVKKTLKQMGERSILF